MSRNNYADEEYEVLDLTENDKWIKKLFGDISKQTAVKQLVIGTGSGWVAGWLFMKVGKVAAASLGFTILIVQVAQHQGYLKINWSNVEKQVNKAKKQLARETRIRYPTYYNNFQRFFQRNIILTGGFCGGFLMGMAF